MVTAVQKVRQPRLGYAGAAPLEARWQEARDQVLARIPAGNPLREAANQMRSEHSIDAMADAVARFEEEKKVAAARNPILNAVIGEACDLARQINCEILEVRSHQHWLTSSTVRNDPWLRLLNLLSPDMYHVPNTLNPEGYLGISDVQIARATVASLHEQLISIRSIRLAIHNARDFLKLLSAIQPQTLKLLRALLDRKIQSDNLLIALQSEMSAITARCDRLERKLKAKT
jgi:hypothetical protein